MLPIYLLIDTSYSMLGEAAESLKVALENMVSAIRSDAQLSHTAQMSVYRFDNDAVKLFPLTPIDQVNLSSTDLQSKGHESNLGKALRLLFSNLEQIKSESDDSPPLLIVISDGHPSDLLQYEEMTLKVGSYGFSSIITCLSGHRSDERFMRLLSNDIYRLDEIDLNTFTRIFDAAFYEYQQDEGGKLSDDLPSEIIIH